MALSPDGPHHRHRKRRHHRARLWDAASGRPSSAHRMHHSGIVFCVAFGPSADHRHRERGQDGSAALGRRHWTYLSAHRCRIRTTCIVGQFSPDGKTVLTGGFDNTARQWDAATGRPLGLPMAHSRLGVVGGVQPRRQDDRHGKWRTVRVRLWDAAYRTGRWGVPLEYHRRVSSVVSVQEAGGSLAGSGPREYRDTALQGR